MILEGLGRILASWRPLGGVWQLFLATLAPRWHFGGQNGRKFDENRGPKTHRKSIAFWERCLSILGRFWDPRLPQKSSKIGQKSPKIGLVGHLVQKPELRRLQGANLSVFGVVWERFWTISDRFLDDFGAFRKGFWPVTCTDPCFEERAIQPLLRNQTSKNTL